MDVGENLKAHIEEKTITCFQGYFSDIPEIHITLSKRHHLFTTELLVHMSRHFTIRSHAEEDDAYRSADHALQKLEKQIKRYKSRLTDRKRHKDADLDAVTMSHYVIKTQEEDTLNDNPVVVDETQMTISQLSASEAVMRLEMSGAPLIVFRNTGTQELNLVYWRKDGHIGWMNLNL